MGSGVINELFVLWFWPSITFTKSNETGTQAWREISEHISEKSQL